MPMMPKRVKFRKSQRGKMKGNATRGNTVAFGEGGVFIRIFPNKPVSGKPLETRMGKGKGEPEYWVAVVKPGTVMFEITGVDETTAKKCLASIAHKMPVPCRFVERRH